MKNDNNSYTDGFNNIPEDLILAWLDGTATMEQMQTLLSEMKTNPVLRDIMQVLTEDTESSKHKQILN